MKGSASEIRIDGVPLNKILNIYKHSEALINRLKILGEWDSQDELNLIKLYTTNMMIEFTIGYEED